MSFLPLYGFVFLGLFSPGPNVILLTASGARFGFWKTLPHLLGVALGVGLTSALTGLGVAAILAQAPIVEIGLKAVATLWILFMAWKLWNSNSADTETENARPMSFVEAVLFQWVNPKVWAVALSATAFVTTLNPTEQAIRLGLTFAILNLFVCLFWTTAGTLLKVLVQSPSAWCLFARSMAIFLVLFSVLIFI